jgi:hypothetical protein
LDYAEINKLLRYARDTETSGRTTSAGGTNVLGCTIAKFSYGRTYVFALV